MCYNQHMNENPVQQRLHETALKAPSKSGVYIWRNKVNTVIYVGKAKNLHNRLSSYFSGTKDVKTSMLKSHAATIEYIVTANEYEAFLLENTLIKKYTPRYNINLKDDKTYPSIALTCGPFPRLFKTRNRKISGARYFGPYPNATALDTFLDAVAKIWPLRKCKTLRKRDNPCLYFHLGQCCAPCLKLTDKKLKALYTQYIGEIENLLDNKDEGVALKAQMQKASAELNFEKAIRLREALKALNILQHPQSVETFDGGDGDYIAFCSEGETSTFTVLKLRGGKLVGSDNHRVVSVTEKKFLVEEFAASYYNDALSIPPNIFIHTDGEEDDFEYTTLTKWMSETLCVQCSIKKVTQDIERYPFHKSLIDMAYFNAKEDIARCRRERGDFDAMSELQRLLNLPTLPHRIEGFDIAHIDGKLPVASLVSFFDGNPDKKNYRYFRLRTTAVPIAALSEREKKRRIAIDPQKELLRATVSRIDDFQSMREVTARRYARLLSENKSFPDLILIDGGIGQVNAVQSVLDVLSLKIPIVGLAKRDEELYRPGCSTPIKVPKRSDALRLLQRVRDEAHRFCTTQNQKLRTKDATNLEKS